jgi:hypothetical protein
MKRIIYIFAFFLVAGFNIYAQPEDILVDVCSNKAGDDATYLKDFIVSLDGVGPGEKAPVAKFSMILKKSTLYRFTICNAESSSDEGVLKLFDTQRMIASNYLQSSGELFESFDFKCQKTGVYHVFISFKEGKAGKAVGILSFVEKL